MVESSSSTAEGKPKTNVPPTVITVDTVGKEGETTQDMPTSQQQQAPSSTNSEAAASQARTPKHANKTKEEERDQKVTPDREGPSSNARGSGGSNPSNQQYRPSFGSGAFQPHDRSMYPPTQQQQHGRGPPPPQAMQVSPGSGRYYQQPQQPSRPYYGQQQQHYGRVSGPSYGHMYPPQQQFQGSAPSWGFGRPPPYPPGPPQEHYARGGPATGNEAFTRAVSGSFDRSVRSQDNKAGGSMEVSPHLAPAQANDDTGSVSEDASWNQLKQVASVDEEEMRKRLKNNSSTPEDGKEVDVKRHTNSNSSSLTNSPTDGVEKTKAALPDPSKLTSSLDSLSSVASAQEPIGTKGKPLSPSGSHGSLDLMKCGSGSSGLLLPSHQRDLSQLSFAAAAESGKRSRAEQRSDVNTSKAAGLEETRQTGESHPTKKRRTDSKNHKKGSPLSITCSPPPTASPAVPSKASSKTHQPKAVYAQASKEASPGQHFYDKAPTFTYSMDSAPPLPRNASGEGYPTLPPRPGSSSSSTQTPMNVEGATAESRHPPGVSQLPSWEIHPQNSFGADSAGGALMSSFSFTTDYPMLSASGSKEESGGQAPSGQNQQQPQQHHERVGHQGHPTLESRNQSFEGGHYHGPIGRSDSMVSYEGRQGGSAYDVRQGYQGQFPPHAPSWGSAGSFPPPPHAYGQFRGHFPPMYRNFSEDSGRASPPPGPPGIRMMPPGFQPPPEFRAPPSMVQKGNPQNTHIVSSNYVPGNKNGPFGWTKEEDLRLTEIMKKYKNPRDWDPIAKELNRGRSAKECHERWIRYLKPGVRKGQWTDQEDAIVMEAVTSSSEQPFTRWSDLAQRLPGRVGKQIRDRWVNHLNPAINHLPFSRDDDLLLWEGHKKLGKRWVEISTKYFNSTRSENHIKNRWYSASFKKFIANEFGPDAYSGGKNKKGSPSKKKTKKEFTDDASHVEAV